MTSVSVFPTTSSNVRLAAYSIYGALPFRARRTGTGRGGSGFQHAAMALACSRALAPSWMPGKRRRSSMAADSSPSRW